MLTRPLPPSYLVREYLPKNSGMPPKRRTHYKSWCSVLALEISKVNNQFQCYHFKCTFNLGIISRFFFKIKPCVIITDRCQECSKIFRWLHDGVEYDEESENEYAANRDDWNENHLRLNILYHSF